MRRRTKQPPKFTPISPVNTPTPTVEESLNLSNTIETTFQSKAIQISNRNMTKVYDLGSGFYGFVEAMRHEPTQHIFAVKRIGFTAETQDRRKLLNDLDVSMRSANCEYVIQSYGALLNEGEIWIVMELMDLSFDKLYKQTNAIKENIPESILLYTCRCVVTALEYLHTEIHVIHRDVKPSNILANREGKVKVCDFGISGNLVNSLAKTNVGSEQYLSPERIVSEKDTYDIRADVWSLGLTLLELAIGTFPYGKWTNLFQQIKLVVENPPPQLPAESKYSNDFRTLIGMCLTKSVSERTTYSAILQMPIIHNLDLPAERIHMSTFVSTILASRNSNEEDRNGSL